MSSIADGAAARALPPQTWSNDWRRCGIALVALLAVTVFAYTDTALAMVSIWYRSDTFAHAFVVPPISVWLIWRERTALSAIAPRPLPLALIAVAAAALAWLLGEAGGVNALSQYAFVAMLVLAVPLTLGFQVTRTLLFPLAFLFFAVPAGEFLLPPLMQATADFTVAALRLSGVPVFREGLRFVIPSGSWSVVEACSGVRYLMASFMVGTLFAYLNYRSLRKRVIFALVSIVVPVVANWVRAYMIVMLAHLTSNKFGAGVDHLIYGWVFFGVVVMLLFMIGARWADDPVPAEHRPATPARPAAGIARWWPALAAVALLAAPPLVTRGWTADDATVPSLRLPDRLAGGWVADDGAKPLVEPQWAGAATSQQRDYALGEQRVGVYLAYYRQQRDGHKLVASTNVVVASQDKQWNMLEGSMVELPGAAVPATLTQWRLREARETAGLAQREVLAWSGYWVDDHVTGSDIEAKARGALQRLLGRGDDAAAIVVWSLAAQPGGTADALAPFWRANIDTMTGLLRDARRTR